MYPEKLKICTPDYYSYHCLFREKIHKLQAKSSLLRDSRIKFLFLLLLLIFMSVFGLAEL